MLEERTSSARSSIVRADCSSSVGWTPTSRTSRLATPFDTLMKGLERDAEEVERAGQPDGRAVRGGEDDVLRDELARAPC